MNNNWDLIEKNEASANANGGTELMLRAIYDGTIPRDLLENFQIVPSRLRELDYSKIRVFACHETAHDPESVKFREQSFRDEFHKFVFISDWQYQQHQDFHGVSYNNKSCVIESAIDPAIINLDKWNLEKENIIHLVYFSMPNRGLNILIDAFEDMVKNQDYKNVILHIYSSFKLYGWEKADEPFKSLFDRCRNHPQIVYHGYVENSVLKKEILNYHALVYPNKYQETSCRVLIESMSAGLLCLHPNFGALSTTSGNLSLVYQGSLNEEEHTNTFKQKMIFLLQKIQYSNSSDLKKEIEFNKNYVDIRFNKEKILSKWKNVLEDLLKQYPDKKSRKKQEPMWVVKTT